MSRNNVRIPGLLREVIESISGGMLLLGLDGGVLVANQEFRVLWKIPDHIPRGRGKDRLLEFVLDQVVDPGEYSALIAEMHAVPETSREDYIETKDGRTFKRHSGPFKLGKALRGHILTFYDVTEHLKMERELRWQAAFLSAQAESTVEGILVVDNDGKKILANRQLLEVWKVPQNIRDDPDDASQLRYVVDRSKNPEQFLEKVTYLYAHPEEHSRDEVEFKDGAVLDRYSAPVIGIDGTHYGRLWSFRDVTELVKARRAAEAASLAKGRFLANMSHEIRTPLNGVIGLTSLLLERELDADVFDIVKTIQASGDTLLRVINDVLDFSRIEAGHLELEPTPTNLPDLANDIVALYQTHAAHAGTVLRALPADGQTFVPAWVMIDPVRVRQILSNLVSNAVKFTHGGEVRLEWMLKMGDAGCVVRFTVSDTGIGIRPDRLNAVFESFTQEDPSIHGRFGGTGLGLAISKRLAELMDGAIGVTSEQGFGSQFWAEIPALPIGVPEEGPTKDGNGPLQIPGGCRVLLAEDNAINVKVALRSLALMGCTVQVAENGIVAIAKALNEDFDLVLMDVMMPECDGLEAARTIRAHEQSRGNRHVPIIALTANGLKGDREVCIDAGMDDFLAKPFTVDRLRSTLHKWVPANQADRLAA